MEHDTGNPEPQAFSAVTWLTDTVKTALVSVVKNADEVTREIVSTVGGRVKDVVQTALDLVTQMG
jgi:hypothetical protein